VKRARHLAKRNARNRDACNNLNVIAQCVESEIKSCLERSLSTVRNDPVIIASSKTTIAALAPEREMSRSNTGEPLKDFIMADLSKFSAFNAFAKKALRETQALGAGCIKAEPRIFAPPQTHFPGARDGQNLISWRWVTTFTDKPSLVRIDTRNFDLSWYQTHKQTKTPTNTHANPDRTDDNTLRRS